jgi:hypothetical protein
MWKTSILFNDALCAGWGRKVWSCLRYFPEASQLEIRENWADFEKWSENNNFKLWK